MSIGDTLGLVIILARYAVHTKGLSLLLLVGRMIGISIMKPKVWNKRDPNTPKDAVYVGRPSKWGNQFKIGDPHPQSDTGKAKLTRNEAIIFYEYYVLNTPELLAEVKAELKGKDLVCWCAPKPCHADILLEIANAK